jgi:hypothetical protein
MNGEGSDGAGGLYAQSSQKARVLVDSYEAEQIRTNRERERTATQETRS